MSEEKPEVELFVKVSLPGPQAIRLLMVSLETNAILATYNLSNLQFNNCTL